MPWVAAALRRLRHGICVAKMRYKELSDFDKKNAFDVERYLKHELRLRMNEEFDCYEVDVSEESTA